MKKIALLALTALAVSIALSPSPARAHGGKDHRLMGTVKTVQPDSLVVTATDGHEVTVKINQQTQCEQGGKSAEKSKLVVGVRVSIHLTEDDTTALLIKIAAAPPG